jgi:hypothetical protein
MISWLLTLVYGIVLLVILIKLRSKLCSALSVNFICTIFIVKVLLGILYTFIHFKLYGGADISDYYNDSIIIYNTLPENPLKFLFLTFGPNNLHHIPHFISSEVDSMGYWGDSSSYSIVRFYAFSNLLSGGNIYTAAVFMAFITSTGLFLFYKASLNIVPHLSDSIVVKILFFGIPSVMFWSSGVHKEGLILFGLGVFFYCLSEIYSAKNIRFKDGFRLIFSLFIIWYVRDFVFYLLLPGMVAFMITILTGNKRIIAVYICVYLFFILSGMLYRFSLKTEKVNYLEAIKIKNEQFRDLKGGNTFIEIPTVKPDLIYVLKSVPKALSLSLAAPFYIENKKWFHFIFIIENFMFLMIIAALFYSVIKNGFTPNSFFIWQLIFAVSILILIGLVVSNIGAIIRYRSIFIPMIFIPLYAMINRAK